MRIYIYCTLGIMAAVLLADTNIGHRVSSGDASMVSRAIAHIAASGLKEDTKLLKRIQKNKGIRQSYFYNYLVSRAERSGRDFSFYAFTPILSRSKIFLGDGFQSAETAGRSSVLIHEGMHIKWHSERLWRGFPRRVDEAHAYAHQYDTHKEIALCAYGGDGTVYWDMMIGIREYVLPISPRYAKMEDIHQAMHDLSQTDDQDQAIIRW